MEPEGRALSGSKCTATLAAPLRTRRTDRKRGVIIVCSGGVSMSVAVWHVACRLKLLFGVVLLLARTQKALLRACELGAEIQVVGERVSRGVMLCVLHWPATRRWMPERATCSM